jgi:hypothetical protein
MALSSLIVCVKNDYHLNDGCIEVTTAQMPRIYPDTEDLQLPIAFFNYSDPGYILVTMNEREQPAIIKRHTFWHYIRRFGRLK